MNRRDFLAASALTALASTLPVQKRQQSESKQPSVLVIVLDSFAAENASLYGYPRQTTPFLDQFAERATVFHRHYAGGNFTAPGTATLLTGCYPWSHRAVNVMGTVTPTFQERQLFHLFGQANYERIALAHTSLAAVLMSQFAKDIDTLQRLENLTLFHDTLLSAALPMSHFANTYPAEMQYVVGSTDAVDGKVQAGSLFLSNVHRVWRTRKREQILSQMRERYPKGLPKTGNAVLFLIEDSIDWLLDTIPQARQPFLTYFHCYAPHFPYTPRREFAEMFVDDGWQPRPKRVRQFQRGNSWGAGIEQGTLNDWRRDYDQYLAFTDAEIGRLLTSLEQNGTLDNTIVVITSDHGELFERGILGHVTPAMYDPVIRIPLLIRLPNQMQRLDITQSTSAADVLPTLLHLTNQTVPNWCEGTILPPYHASSSTAPVFSLETKNSNKRGDFATRSVVTIKEEYKLIHYVNYPAAVDVAELYNIADDPEERNDVSERHPELVQELKELGMERLIQAGVV